MSFGQVGNVSVTNPVGFLTPFGPREINEVPLDVVVEEAIQHSVVVTQHPIEIGSANGVSRGTIADHAYVEPTTYTMRGGVSDTPISWRIFRTDRLTKYANSQGKTRSLSAYELLLKHFRETVPFTLRTPFGDLENMLFRRFTVNRDQSTKHAIIFYAEMVELQFVVPETVSSARTEADVTGDQAQTQAVDEVYRGDVSPIPVP